MNTNIPINNLNIKDNIVLKLNENNIFLINELWRLNRAKLKAMGFTNDEINSIIIKLQLSGLDLNQRKY